jgi:hypothetical protein
MATVSDADHISPQCDLRTGREAFCQRNVHKPRLIPLFAAMVVQDSTRYGVPFRYRLG